MDLKTNFGLPIQDLMLLKSMKADELKAVGIDAEEFQKSFEADLSKARGDLTPVQKVVTRGGKQVNTTVWVKPGDSYKSVSPGDRVKFKDGKGKEHEGEVKGLTSRLQHQVEVDGKVKKINHDQVTAHAPKGGAKKDDSAKKPAAKKQAARGGLHGDQMNFNIHTK